MALGNVAKEKLVTSASAVLSLLGEPSRQIQIFALERLNSMVDLYWPEIADSVSEIEKLYEDEDVSHRELAALVVSKVYYHLEDYREASRYALCAGKLFNPNEKSQYANTIVAKCIEEYIKKRDDQYEQESRHIADDLVEETSAEVVIDPRLERVFERMVDACREKGELMQSLGVAFDARRLDIVEQIIMTSSPLNEMLQHCLKNCQSLIASKRFRSELVDLLIKIYKTFRESELEMEYPHLCLCLFHRGDADSVAEILIKLIQRDSDRSELMAYQIGFDLVDLECQSFLKDLLENQGLRLSHDPEDPQKSQDLVEQLANKKEYDDSEIKPLLEQEVGQPSNSAHISVDMSKEAKKKQKLSRLRYILTGKASIELALQFLHRNNRSDLFLLDQIRNAVDPRNSITHHAIVIAHGLMQAGTTNDAFLRPNLEWFGKAINWAKFSAAASLGVIHKGHIKQSRNVLGAYLPKGTGERGSPYSEGGALYALGLINANHSDDSVKEYLLNNLRAANNEETLQHGACLGLGLLCMGQNDEALYDELKGVMFMDSAVAGEAAGYAIGLLMLGSASSKATGDLLSYAHDTQHEKIIRACSVAVGLVMYRREEEADPLIDQLSVDKDALIRYGAMYCIGLAYCGTSKNSAISRLLHISVSDVCDDVRRAAVIALGFVLCNTPHQVPKILNLLSESYNPHIRYATALAIGISCAGTAMHDAIKLLIPMTVDSTDFVRQGALIGLGLLFQQTSEAMNADVKTVRETIMKVIGDKHEDVMTRFGAVLAAGLIDAGGRNCAASFFSKTGNLRQEAAVGFCLFTQLWYWFPLIHCISLAFEASALIGLNIDLKMPNNFEFICYAKPELFAYPQPVPREKKEEKKETMHAVLSTAAKRQAMEAKKSEKTDSTVAECGRKVTRHVPPDVDMKPVDPSVTSTATKLKSEFGDEVLKLAVADECPEGAPVSSAVFSRDKDVKNLKQKEQTLKSPCRIIPRQESYVEFMADARYIPVFPGRKSGFLMLRDTRPHEKEDLVEPKHAKSAKEPEAPEAFEWTG